MKRHLSVALFVGSLAVGATPLLAATTISPRATSAAAPGPSIESIDSSQFPKVTATVILPIAARMAIEAGAQVTVTENGSPVTAVSSYAKDTPPEVVIVIDRSKSMRSVTFSATRNAASAFVASLPADVPVAIVSFSSRVTVDAPRTTDRQAVTSAINKLNAGGSTALYDAIIVGSKQFSKSSGQKLMIVLSDGGDSNSKKSLASALTAAGRVETHFIEISTSQRHHQLLQYLGGENSVFTATNPSDIDRGFRSVAGYISGRIQISFESKAANGTTSQVAISVVHNGERISVRSAFETPASTPGGSSSQRANLFTRSSTLIVVIGLATLFYGLTMVVFSLLATPGRSVRTRLTPRSPDSAKVTGVSAIDRLGQRVSRMLATTSRLEHLMQDIDDANLASSPARFLVINGVVAVGVAIVAGAFSNGMVALAAFFFTLFIERKRLSSRVTKRRTEFIAQLPDTLQMLSSMLRSGYGLVQALDTVADEAIEPTRSWLGQVMLEVRAGRDLVNSLQALAASIDSLDFDWVVAGIEISREVGGDLAKTLDTVSGTIRERDELRAHINALTAEGRLSAYVMLVLPPAVAVMSLLINPEFGSLLFQSSGIPMMIGAGVLMVFGFIWMRKIIAKVA